MANLNQFCDFTKLIGIDIAKSVFQIYSCDTQTGEITNVQIKRDKVLESLANCRQMPYRHGGMRQLPILGPQTAGTRPYCPADGSQAREAFRSSQQE